MGLQDFFTWRSQTTTTPSMDEETPADVDEPPDHRRAHDAQLNTQADFHKAIIRPSAADRKESLLTKALTQPDHDDARPHVHVTTDLTRRRSMLSNASIASTAELTSDGGLTSPARTNTPSPPPPSNLTSFAPYSLVQKTTHLPEPRIAKVDSHPLMQTAQPVDLSPKAQVPAAEPKKRYISFACGGTTKAKPKPAPVVEQAQPTTQAIVEPTKKRACKISFACAAPKPSEGKQSSEDEKKQEEQTRSTSKSAQNLKPAGQTPRRLSRSPAAFRKSPRSAQPPRPHRDSNATVRHASQSPVQTRVKPRYIIADEKTLQDSEATRFSEFSSGKLEEDDWIKRDEQNPRERLTINDTLKKENAIRQLGNEAEEEALEEDEEDEEEEDEEEEEDFEDEDEDVDDDEDFSDGNETDNEAGFAESDDSDGEGDFANFWTPGGRLHNRDVDGASTYRPSAHRTASASSMDSMEDMLPHPVESKLRRPLKQRPIKIRPGTPELPDSTDFVCGTLDEDRPMEDAYVSCREARKNAKHKLTPQDIDPSFPTSDIDDEEDDEDLNTARSSEENMWMHGKFEESDGERPGRRGSRAARRKSPLHSPPPPGGKKFHSPPPKRLHSPPPPKRLHSPPPPKTRLRSPPPRRLFGGHSPKRARSPLPARHVASPAASPTSHNTTTMPIAFAPLGSRPGLTHTKSLPRTPNVFCRQYDAARLAAANGNDGNDNADGHVRGAIDIVKGLEHKRQRRKEKFHQKQAKGKAHNERRTAQPGVGAERMREIGLLMAGKSDRTDQDEEYDPYILSA